MFSQEIQLKLETIFEKIANELQLWAVALVGLDQTGSDLKYLANHNLPPDWQALTTPVNGQTFSSKSFLDGEEQIWNQPLKINGPQTTQVVSARIILPVFYNDKVIATLELFRIEEGTLFTEMEIEKAKEFRTEVCKILTHNLDFYRQQIDDLDKTLLETLAKRIECVKQVGIYKKEHELPALSPQRWKQVLVRLKTEAKKIDLDEQLVLDLWNRIHDYTVDLEEGILKSKK